MRSQLITSTKTPPPQMRTKEAPARVLATSSDLWQSLRVTQRTGKTVSWCRRATPLLSTLLSSVHEALQIKMTEESRTEKRHAHSVCC